MKFDKEHRLPQLYLLFLLGIALALLLYTVLGFWIMPPVVKHLVEKNLSEKLHRQVSIERIRINPYELSFSITGFAVREVNSTENFLAFDELHAVLQGGSIVERALIVSELKVSGPCVNITRIKDDQFNFSDLLEEKAPPPKTSDAREGKSQTFKFLMKNVQIVNGRVDFNDESKGEKEKIENLHLELPLITNLGETRDGWTKLTVTAKINQSPLSVAARVNPFSDHLESVVDVDLSDLDVTEYLAYLPPQLKFKVRSGRGEAKLKVTYYQAEEGPALKVSGEAAMNAFEAVDPNDSNLITLPRVSIAIESFEPLAGKLHLSKVLFQSPEMDLWRNQDGTLNVQQLVAGSGTEPAVSTGNTTAPGFLIAVDDIEVAHGRMGFVDHGTEPNFRTALEAIDLSIKQFSNTPGARASIKFGARTEANETLGTEGSLSLDPLHYDGKVEVTGIVAANYAPYYSKEVLFDVLDGKFDLKTTLRVRSNDKHLDLKLSDLSASVISMKLKKRDEADNILEIPSLQLKEGSVDVAGKEFTIGELFSQNGKIALVRLENGELNTQTMVPATPELGTGKYVTEGIAQAEQSSWRFLVRKLTLKDYLVRFEDRKVAEPTVFLVDQINLDGQNLSPAEDSKAKILLSCRVNEGGTVQMEGGLNIMPVFADLKLSLKDIGITPVQPYLPEDIKVKLTSGKLSAAGNLLLRASQEDSLNASYGGDVLLSDFSSVEEIGGEDFLRWKSLEMKEIDAGNNPSRASIKRVGVKDFFSRIAISPDGKINLLEILGTQTEAKPAAGGAEKGLKGKKGQPPTLKIDQIALQGGEIAFSDKHIKPNFHAELFAVGGTISGLSSTRETTAEVNLRGELYRSSPLEITGKLRPFPDSLYADLSVNFKNIEMTPWNPYAQKYIGYTLEKGKLQLELKYLIVKKKIDSQNRIVLEQLTLGDKVDSPDATTLPVKFAISLLQDRNGEIQLGIPVTGNLDDPQLSVGEVIVNAVKNLIVKAITAPFTFLSSLLPQGVGEINHVDIDSATGNITEGSAKKLDAVAGILHDRPNLELDLQGMVEAKKGEEILKQDLFGKKLKTEKLKEMMKKGASGVSLDQITISPDEVPKYLKMAYEEEFPKEGLAKVQFWKKTPPEVMKNQLLATIQVTDDDLRSLAYGWAMKVREYLEKSGKVEPRRLFVLEPKISGAAATAEAAGNGVNLTLK